MEPNYIINLMETALEHILTSSYKAQMISYMDGQADQKASPRQTGLTIFRQSSWSTVADFY